VKPVRRNIVKPMRGIGKMVDGRVPTDCRKIGGLFQEGRCNRRSIDYQKKKKVTHK
jgi:hypothetical protein